MNTQSPVKMRFDDRSTWPEKWIDRCEIIASNMTFRNRETGEEGVKWTAIQVFRHHPTGELFQVNEWFINCLIHLELEERTAAGENPQAVLKDLLKRKESPEAQEAYCYGAFSKRSQ